eukprot:3066357-Rhodomonas_salina.1
MDFASAVWNDIVHRYDPRTPLALKKKTLQLKALIANINTSRLPDEINEIKAKLADIGQNGPSEPEILDLMLCSLYHSPSAGNVLDPQSWRSFVFNNLKPGSLDAFFNYMLSHEDNVDHYKLFIMDRPPEHQRGSMEKGETRSMFVLQPPAVSNAAVCAKAGDRCNVWTETQPSKRRLRPPKRFRTELTLEQQGLPPIDPGWRKEFELWLAGAHGNEQEVETMAVQSRGGRAEQGRTCNAREKQRSSLTHLTLDAHCSTPDARRSSLVARRSSLVTRRSSLVHSSLDVRRSTFDARCSRLDTGRSFTHHSTLDARRLTLVVRGSTLDTRSLITRRSTLRDMLLGESETSS